MDFRATPLWVAQTVALVLMAVLAAILGAMGGVWFGLCAFLMGVPLAFARLSRWGAVDQITLDTAVATVQVGRHRLFKVETRTLATADIERVALPSLSWPAGFGVAVVDSIEFRTRSRERIRFEPKEQDLARLKRALAAMDLPVG